MDISKGKLINELKLIELSIRYKKYKEGAQELRLLIDKISDKQYIKCD